MSAAAVTKELASHSQREYDTIVRNYANGDMVGHSGNLRRGYNGGRNSGSVLGKTCQRISEVGGQMLITADHGNVEKCEI
ncbi:MAG: hypothetical protein CM15mP68_5680 [Pseudomonadota bacterium]|nr:MAG: hypothetical protein CM15mP68_5680 [Pseudomonadota bacterium]